MFTRIQDLEDIQGGWIRNILARRGPPVVEPLTPALVAQAHAAYVPLRPGAPQPHHSERPVVMFIAKGKWKGLCPECRCGVTAGAGWEEARCFECGAILRAVWPADRAAVEAAVLSRVPVEQWWHPDEET